LIKIKIENPSVWKFYELFGGEKHRTCTKDVSPIPIYKCKFGIRMCKLSE
jgi:hypothetical protein